MRMKYLPLILLLAACAQQDVPRSRSGDTKVQTVEATDPRPTVLQPPPQLSDEAAAPSPKPAPGQAVAAAPLSLKDEEVRARLPFAPAIAMDPVNGSKISIRADTPMVELKNKIYYFSSEENKRTFMANPEQFMKGLFSHV